MGGFLTKDEGPIWICRDGRAIPIAKMEDAHITNTVKMIRRNGGVTSDELGAMFRAAGSLQGEYAQMAADSAIESATVSRMLPHLLEEAERRGLKGVR